jgi:hypothetical protein
LSRVTTGDLAPCDFFLFPEMKQPKRMQVWYHWGDPGWIAESAWHSDRKGLPGSIPKMEEMVEPMSTCGRELLQGWWRPICLMVSFMICTVSVWNIVDITTYLRLGECSGWGSITFHA